MLIVGKQSIIIVIVKGEVNCLIIVFDIIIEEPKFVCSHILEGK